MNRILYSKSMQRTKVVIVMLIMIILIVLCFFGFGIITSKGAKMLNGVSISAIDLSGKTYDEAVNTLEEYQTALDNKKYILTFENREVSVSGEELELKYDKKLIDEAYMYGRSGNILENTLTAWKSLFNAKNEIPSEFTINLERLNEKLEALLEEENAQSKDDTYEISGEKILVLKGHDGVTANNNDVKDQILKNADSAESQVNIEISTHIEKAQRVDFDKIFKEVFVEKKNASYDQEKDGSIKYIQEVVGIAFDKNLAEKEYSNLKDDDTMQIALMKDVPEITTANLEDILFGEILATYKTTYNASNKDRSTNLEVAARNINGTILLPGEEFSYNKEVGQRTVANGFKEAHVFAGGKVVDGLGGGICQISSTLYNAILAVDGIEITERKNHMMYPEYVKPSLDATVVWGSIDFRFKNNRETPIKIVATVKNGVATTTIYGKKAENEPIIELESVVLKTIPYTTVTEYDDTMDEGTTVVTQSPVNGYESKAYKIVKDKNGNQISKTLISTDTYRQTSKIVKVGTKKVTVVTPPVEEVVTPDQPTQPSTPSTPGSSDLPTGWDSPENPYYTGN